MVSLAAHPQQMHALTTQQWEQPCGIKELGISPWAPQPSRMSLLQPFSVVLPLCNPPQQKLAGPSHLPSTSTKRVISVLSNSSQATSFALQLEFLAALEIPIWVPFVFVQRT